MQQYGNVGFYFTKAVIPVVGLLNTERQYILNLVPRKMSSLVAPV